MSKFQLVELVKINSTKNITELNQVEVKELQKALNICGFNAGPEDGILGNNTKKAFSDFKISTYQKELSLIGVGSIKTLQDRINKTPDKITKISDNGIKLIEFFEGKRNHAYLDPVGLKTIGVGHLMKPNETIPDYLTDEQVHDLLRKDVHIFETAVSCLVKVPINQNQFDSLVSFSFNLGVGALESSTLLRFLNKGDYIGAADQFLVWNKAGGRILEGLVIRREKERELFLK